MGRKTLSRMRNLKNNLLKTTKRVKHLARPLKYPKRYVHKNVPYFAQWESRELNKQILTHEIEAVDDPKWKLSGAKTKQEYASWSWAGCGMACTKMVLAHKTGKVIPLVELGKKCAEYGGYTLPLESSPGMYYKPYVDFMAGEFGIKTTIVSAMLPQEIMHQLSLGNYVIASVSPKIRDPRTSAPRVRGGHLVLIVGYDQDKREFYLSNPSGNSIESQEYAAVSFTDFPKFFGNRGIVIQG